MIGNDGGMVTIGMMDMNGIRRNDNEWWEMLRTDIKVLRAVMPQIQKLKEVSKSGEYLTIYSNISSLFLGQYATLSIDNNHPY